METRRTSKGGDRPSSAPSKVPSAGTAPGKRGALRQKGSNNPRKIKHVANATAKPAPPNQEGAVKAPVAAGGAAAAPIAKKEFEGKPKALQPVNTDKQPKEACKPAKATPRRTKENDASTTKKNRRTAKF